MTQLKKYKSGFLGREREIDIYYSRPDVDFMKTRECLRIITKENAVELIYKSSTTEKWKKQKNWKKEINLNFNYQINEAKELLKNLGFIELVIV